MKTRNIIWIAIIIIANLILINLALYLFLNLTYPMVGSDYRLAIPSMLDTVIHYRNNGLTIQWYTPSFGGGVPAFPDPNNSQFSLLEILPLLMTPWQAVFVSSVIYISLGFIASYRFFQKVLKLSVQASILGAVFFSANGFMMERVAVGHLGYQPFPLLAAVLLLFLDQEIPAGLAGLLLGAVAALLINQAGFFLIIVFALASLMTFPLIYLFRTEMFSWRHVTITLISGIAIGLLLSASKLSAIYSFMRFFPRLAEDVYSVNPISGILGIILQLLGTMNLLPMLSLARLDSGLILNFLIFTTGAFYGYWEFDMSMSPVVFGIIIVGVNMFFHAPRKYFKKYTANKKWVAFLLFIFFVWLSIEFTLANGWFYLHLRQLPILSSLHVNARFAAAFLFPLALIAAVMYDSWTRYWPEKKSIRTFILINIVTLLPLSSFFMFKDDLQARVYDIRPSLGIYQSFQAGEKFEVTGISDQESNTEALQNRLSNLNLYDPIFGYLLENFHPEIKPGSIWDVSHGYFNMTNPSGYVFPEINQTRPFERIKIQDREKLAAFANHDEPGWKIPRYQKICNWVTTLTLALAALFLCVYSFRALQVRISKRQSIISIPAEQNINDPTTGV